MYVNKLIPETRSVKSGKYESFDISFNGRVAGTIPITGMERDLVGKIERRPTRSQRREI